MDPYHIEGDMDIDLGSTSTISVYQARVGPATGAGTTDFLTLERLSVSLLTPYPPLGE